MKTKICGGIKQILMVLFSVQLIAVFLTFVYYHGKYSTSQLVSGWFSDFRFYLYMNSIAMIFFPSLCFFRFLLSKYLKKYYTVLLLHLVLLLSSAYVGTLCAVEIIKYVFWYEFNHDQVVWRIRDNFIIISIIYICYMAVYMFRKHYSKKNKEIEILNRLRAESKFAALQSKMNPHFLFNTLNTILELAKTDLTKLEIIVENLSEIYRYIINIHDNQLIELGMELNIVEKYLEIEKMRLGHRLLYTIDCPKEAKNCMVVPLMVEAMVENAIIHGISLKNDGGRVSILVNKDNNKLIITIADTGVGFYTESARNGFGIRSVKERLALLFGSRAQCRISTQPGEGTHVALEIPYENNRIDH